MLSSGQYGGSDLGRQMQRRIDEAEAEARSHGRPITGYKPLPYRYGHSGKGGIHSTSVNVPIFGKSEAEMLAPIQAEQQRLAGIQQASYEKQQADITSQLKILEGEKSAVAKAQQDYSNMLIAEAERKKQAQEQAERNLATQRANQAMAGRSGALQIQGAGTTSRIGGTQQFRRRPLQQGAATPYKGLSTIQSGMVNV
jgi:hypothetical protein